MYTKVNPIIKISSFTFVNSSFIIEYKNGAEVGVIVKEFKDVFRNLRVDRNMTQDELADALGLTKQAVSHYERGSRYPRRDRLELISDFFNVDMDYLTGRSSVTTRLLSEEELRLINAYRGASSELKTAACAVLGVKRSEKE